MRRCSRVEGRDLTVALLGRVWPSGQGKEVIRVLTVVEVWLDAAGRWAQFWERVKQSRILSVHSVNQLFLGRLVEPCHTPAHPQPNSGLSPLALRPSTLQHPLFWLTLFLHACLSPLALSSYRCPSTHLSVPAASLCSALLSGHLS